MNNNKYKNIKPSFSTAKIMYAKVKKSSRIESTTKCFLQGKTHLARKSKGRLKLKAHFFPPSFSVTPFICLAFDLLRR